VSSSHNSVNHFGPTRIVGRSSSGSGKALCQSTMVQPSPSGFILVGFTSTPMVGNPRSSFTRYLKFLGKCDEDGEKH
jgi:hypothetical protein